MPLRISHSLSPFGLDVLFSHPFFRLCLFILRAPCTAVFLPFPLPPWLLPLPSARIQTRDAVTRRRNPSDRPDRHAITAAADERRRRAESSAGRPPDVFTWVAGRCPDMAAHACGTVCRVTLPAGRVLKSAPAVTTWPVRRLFRPSHGRRRRERGGGRPPV